MGVFLLGGYMIKRIIFDVDNTLIPWHNEYIDSYGYALDELGVSHTSQDVIDIDDAIDKYEKYYNIYDRKKMNDFIKERVNIDLPDKFIPSQTLFPANVPEQLLNDIVKYESLIAERIKPRFAIVHTEWLWNETETETKLACVESALRGGGVFISSHIIPDATGLNINDLLIDFALGKDINIEEFFTHRISRAAGYVCFYLPKGTIIKIEGREKLRSLDGVDLVCLDNINIGDHPTEMTHKGQRIGPIIVYADSRESLETKILECQKILNIEVKDNFGLIRGPIWK